MLPPVCFSVLSSRRSDNTDQSLQQQHAVKDNAQQSQREQPRLFDKRYYAENQSGNGKKNAVYESGGPQCNRREQKNQRQENRNTSRHKGYDAERLGGAASLLRLRIAVIGLLITLLIILLYRLLVALLIILLYRLLIALLIILLYRLLVALLIILLYRLLIALLIILLCRWLIILLIAGLNRLWVALLSGSLLLIGVRISVFLHGFVLPSVITVSKLWKLPRVRRLP